MARSRQQREDDYADADRRLNEHGSGEGRSIKLPKGLKFFSSKRQGDYEIDIVPYRLSKNALKFAKNYGEVGKRYWERTYFVHFNIGPNEDKVVCPAKTCGQPCPICEHAQELKQDPKADRKKIDGQYRPKERQLFLVYDRKEESKGIQLWDISNFCFGANLDEKVNNAKTEKRQKYKYFWKTGTDGYTLRVIGKEKSMGDAGRPFNFFTIDEFMEREETLPDKIIDHGYCLDDLPILMSYKEIEKLFNYKSPEAEDDETDDEDSELELEGDDEEEQESDTESEEEEVAEEDGESEEDDKEDDDEESDIPTKGMTVQFKYKGKMKVGKVMKVNKTKGIAEIKVTGQEKLSVVDFEELELVEDDEEVEEEEVEEEEPEEEEEEKKPTRRGKKSAPKEEDDDDPFGEDEEEVEEEEPEEEEEVKPRRKPKK